MRRLQKVGAALPIWLACWGGWVNAQWVTQDIELRPGWNAVFFDVDPEPADIDLLVDDAPFEVETILTYGQDFQTVQFLIDTNEVLAPSPDWLKWVPAQEKSSVLRNLYRFSAGTPYFIKVAGVSGPVTWPIKGQPVARSVHWRENRFNLVGFPVSRANPPTFDDFFAASPEHAGQPIYRMNPQGGWGRVLDPSVTAMCHGEAFWIRIDRFSRYQGPVAVETHQRSGLSYGESLSELPLFLRNDSDETQQFQIRYLSSDPMPATVTHLLLAGDVPLRFYDETSTNGWEALPPTLIVENVQPGERKRLRIAACRQGMSAFSPPPGAEALYQSLLEITDEDGFLDQVVAVSASSLMRFDPAGNAYSERAGLWVGNAVVKQVNYIAAGSPAHVPVDVDPSAQFQFRVIVHVHESGLGTKLLQHVQLMFVEGTNTQGRFVLVSDDELVPTFLGAVMQDGTPVGRRISSAAFGFDEPQDLVGEFGVPGQSLVLAQLLTIGYDDPVNPFKHAYHPDHDNLDPSFDQANPIEETYTVSRDIEMHFTADDPESDGRGLVFPCWGDNQVGGIWRETVKGLRHADIELEGIFRLSRVSTIGVLNDER